MDDRKIDRYDGILIIVILTLSILEYNLKHPYGILVMELTILVILLNIIYIGYKFYCNKTMQKYR
ncbi:hypothetical protein [Methanocaldococcus sp.]